MPDPDIKPFGAYPPPPGTLVLRAITRLGFSRGKINRWVSSVWINKNRDIVDATVRGIRYRLNIRLNTTDIKLLSSSRYYDKAELDALDASRLSKSNSASEPSTFVDLGANTGYYALELWKRGFDRVIAIEPSPVTLKMLTQNVALNDASGITIVPLGVGDGGEVDFYTSGGLGAASMLEKNHPNTQAIKVKTKPLNDILEDQGVASVDAMKVDIEGLAIDGDHLWVTGSHSLKRDKPDLPSDDHAAAMAALRAYRVPD